MMSLLRGGEVGLALLTIFLACVTTHGGPELEYSVGYRVVCCDNNLTADAVPVIDGDHGITPDPFESEQGDDQINTFGGKNTGSFSKNMYKKVLRYSWIFLDAQRSGKIPDDGSFPVPWRKSSHVTDIVPGGWYDAGDYLKLNFPLAYSVAMLSWGIEEFKSGYKSAGIYDSSKDSLKVAVRYLMDCHIKKGSYIGQIGHPDIDHAYWGRAHEQKGPRPYFVWTTGMRGADLMAKVSAALAASALVYREDDRSFSSDALEHAEQLYVMAKKSPGLYSSHFKSATQIYPSSDWVDDMAWAAAWLFKATSKRAYLTESVEYWTKKYWDVTVSWDNLGASTAILLYQLDTQGAHVPRFTSIAHYVEKRFLNAWIRSNGKEDIVKTPKGMSRPSWSSWGNLQLSTSSGFLALVCAKYVQSSTLSKSASRWAQSQVDYAMGDSGRSFVVGFGKRFPRYPHHAGASCPREPRTCNWSIYESNAPNANILYGALVGGPSGPGDSSYRDRRDDYVTNEVAVDYNAAFSGALAGLIEYLDA